jgi:hypothetical protein
MNWDRVLTINDYYDGPRLGIAEVNGIPHIYEAEYDHNDEVFGDTYFLSPVDEELLSLILEDWGIWLRWDAAFKKDEVTVENHPALPADRERHEAIKLAVGDRLRVNAKEAIYLKAEFRNLPAGKALDGWEVQWSQLPASGN